MRCIALHAYARIHPSFVPSFLPSFVFRSFSRIHPCFSLSSVLEDSFLLRECLGMEPLIMIATYMPSQKEPPSVKADCRVALRKVRSEEQMRRCSKQGRVACAVAYLRSIHALDTLDTLDSTWRRYASLEGDITRLGKKRLTGFRYCLVNMASASHRSNFLCRQLYHQFRISIYSRTTPVKDLSFFFFFFNWRMICEVLIQETKTWTVHSLSTTTFLTSSL